jgi:hypothetical protein
MTDDVGFDEVAGPPSPHRRGRHRRPRRNPMLFVVPTGAVLALAVSVAVGSRSADPPLPAQPSHDIAQEPDASPDPSWLTPSDAPTSNQSALPVPISPTPTDDGESPGAAPPPEPPASGPVAPTATSSPNPDEPPGHSATGPGNKPPTPPGHSKRTPSPVPSDIP